MGNNTINSSEFGDWKFSGTDDFRTYTSSFTYYFNEVKLSLDNNPNFCSSGNCRSLSYGVVSDPNDKNNTMDFKLTFTPPKSNGITVTGTCYYRLDADGLINRDDLNLEFRVIDTNNPFPGINGKGRDTKTNWCGIDKDGKVNCSRDNNVVKKYITDRNNSYSKDAKYVIELTPSDIKNIRKYNKQNSYNDSNYFYVFGNGLTKYKDFEECRKANGENDCTIKSKFLSSLGNKLTINNG